MLTYEIRANPIPPQKTLSKKYDTTSEKGKIEALRKKLLKCPFEVGDKVAFKKPRRNAIRGIIIHIEKDASQCNWQHGAPQYIVVDGGKSGVLATHETKLRKLP
jgi:hypothetical protein